MHLAFLVAARLGQDLSQLQDAGPIKIEVTVKLGDLGQSDGGHGAAVSDSMENTAATMPAMLATTVEGMYYNLALDHSGDLTGILEVAGGKVSDIWHTGQRTQGLVFGIWHTGVKVFGKEYFYNSAGIHTGNPGHGVLMPGTNDPFPVQHTAIKALGETTKSEAKLDVYLKELRETKFTADNYDLLGNSCNHFADEVAKFLLGEDAGSPMGDDEEAPSPIGGDVLNFGSNLEASLSKNAMIAGIFLPMLKTDPNVHGEAVAEADSGVKVVQDLLAQVKGFLPTARLMMMMS